MNIVFVNPEYPSPSSQDHGGIATYIYNMANALAIAGNTVHILAKSNTIPDPLHAEVFFHTFDHTPIPRIFPWIDRITGNDAVWERGYSLAARNLILEIHRSAPIDIVEIAEYNGLAFECGPPLTFPVVVHFHTPTRIIDIYNQKKVTGRQRRWYAFEEHALKRAQSFRSPSISLKNEICRLYEIPAEKIRIIPHPCDTAPFDAITRKTTAKSVIDILFSGRLERRKGGEIMQRNIHRILSLDPRINLTFVGELDMGDAGEFRNPIERSLLEQQRHRIWFLGPTKHCDLPVLYRNSDIFLIPSLFENAPFALLEAMAAGLPIIGSATSGIMELIGNDDNGLLFDIQDQDGLVNCIKTLIGSPARAADFAKKAYDDVKKRCNPNSVARETISFYTDVIRSFSRQKN